MRRYKANKKKVLLFFILFAVGTWLLVANLNSHNPGQKTKEQFEDTFAAQKELRQRIINQFGEPISTREEKSCGYASRKFEKGPLGCGVRVYLSYEVTDHEVADRQARQIDEFVGQQTDVLTRSSNIFFIGPEKRFSPRELSGRHQQASAGFDFIDESLLGLSLSFNYYLEEDSRDRLEVGLSAGGEARGEFYPVKESPY